MILGMFGPEPDDPSIAEKLQHLRSDDPEVRRRAVRALGRLGLRAIQALAERLGYEETPWVRRDVAEVLRAVGRAWYEIFLRRLRDGTTEARERAADALGWMGQAAAVPEVLPALVLCLETDTYPSVRRAAADALGWMGQAAAAPEVLRALAGRLRDEDRAVRVAAAWALGRMGPAAAAPEVLEALAERLRDEDPAVRRAAADALRAMGPAAATLETFRALAGCLRDRDRDVRRAATEALVRLAPAG